ARAADVGESSAGAATVQAGAAQCDGVAREPRQVERQVDRVGGGDLRVGRIEDDVVSLDVRRERIEIVAPSYRGLEAYSAFAAERPGGRDGGADEGAGAETEQVIVRVTQPERVARPDERARTNHAFCAEAEAGDAAPPRPCQVDG